VYRRPAALWVVRNTPRLISQVSVLCYTTPYHAPETIHLQGNGMVCFAGWRSSPMGLGGSESATQLTNRPAGQPNDWESPRVVGCNVLESGSARPRITGLVTDSPGWWVRSRFRWAGNEDTDVGWGSVEAQGKGTKARVTLYNKQIYVEDVWNGKVSSVSCLACHVSPCVHGWMQPSCLQSLSWPSRTYM
jgi:hypothetical protein